MSTTSSFRTNDLKRGRIGRSQQFSTPPTGAAGIECPLLAVATCHKNSCPQCRRKRTNPIRRERPKLESLSVLVLECTERGRRLLRLDAREPDHLAPLFRFISDVFAKVGARACKQHSTA